jgi:hypothetical protein
MIPATGRYTAYYGEKLRIQKPVEAWDDDGEALVANDKGRLVRASSYSNFDGVEQASDDRIVSVLPGGGWQFKFQGEAETWIAPVLGWAVDEQGYATALQVEPDENGYGPMATPCKSTTVELLPPAGSEQRTEP